MYILWSTMGEINPFKGPSYASMKCSENFILDPNYVNRSLPKIISYLPLAESHTWQFLVTIFIALSSGKVKYIINFMLVLVLPACVRHCISTYSLGVSFSISLLVKIVELYLIFNQIWKFLVFSLPFSVFAHPCRIVD